MISFYKWCVDKYYGEDSPLGDLASDIKNDKGFPRESKNKREIIQYLECKNACSGCIESFDYAFKQYYKEVKNERK